MSLTYYLCGFFVCVVCTLGCGISTHTEIGHRAIEFFGYDSTESTEFIRNILLNNQARYRKGTGIK